jgi:hypothetical protein
MQSRCFVWSPADGVPMARSAADMGVGSENVNSRL